MSEFDKVNTEHLLHRDLDMGLLFLSYAYENAEHMIENSEEYDEILVECADFLKEVNPKIDEFLKRFDKEFVTKRDRIKVQRAKKLARKRKRKNKRKGD